MNEVVFFFFGFYIIMPRSKKIPAVGSRAQVLHGNAVHTSGYLYKEDLKKNKFGKIVSRKASALAKKRWPQVKEYFKDFMQK